MMKPFGTSFLCTCGSHRSWLRLWPLVALIWLFCIADSRGEQPPTRPASPTATRPSGPTAAWEKVTDADIAKIDFRDAEEDDAVVTPLDEDLSQFTDDEMKVLEQINGQLDRWKPGQEADLAQQM